MKNERTVLLPKLVSILKEMSENIKLARLNSLDPDLDFYSGKQYLRYDKPKFGLFLDSFLDRWERVFMRRRESILAKKENRPVQTLYESYFLLGI